MREVVQKVEACLGIQAERTLPQPFIVHGHDDKTKLELKNFLQNTLGLPEPIILHEQPNLGRTSIEKFEVYAGNIDNQDHDTPYIYRIVRICSVL